MLGKKIQKENCWHDQRLRYYQLSCKDSMPKGITLKWKRNIEWGAISSNLQYVSTIAMLGTTWNICWKKTSTNTSEKKYKLFPHTILTNNINKNYAAKNG